MSAKPKFLFDVGVGNVIEKWVEDRGFDSIAIRNLDPRMSDLEILNLAVKEKRIVVTMDKDFGELVFGSNKRHFGVLLLRLENASSDEKLLVIKSIFKKYLDELPNHFCVYQNQTLRIK